MADQKKKSDGGIWKKKDKNGNQYFSISFKGRNFAVFLNQRRDSDRQPNFLIYENEPSAPKQQQSAPPDFPPQESDDSGWPF